MDPAAEFAEQFDLVGDLLVPMMDEIDTAVSAGVPGRISSGFARFDEITAGGFQGGTLTVLAGSPGAGSTALALGFVRTAAIRHRIGAAYLPLGTSPWSITQRLLSAEAGIETERLKTGRLSQLDRRTVARCRSEIDKAPLVIKRPDSRDITVLTQQITELAADGARLSVVDPLHKINIGDLPFENRQREVSEVTRQLKVLALDTNTAIITTAHLSSPRQRIDYRQHLSDLRESGSIAHIADLVVLINRPSLWTDDTPRIDEVDLDIAKHRHGPADVELTVEHQLHLSRLIGPGQVRRQW
ncbi:DnaB-like helicase C-terminal domain-containing protein (plasmid) [Nocardia sp. CA-129566]|uniref:DnaB-like helicase C-terminal domain-containing protein n=1 Tax=Nocardia sp. CA-129566 TaxID=3239976 RepID=UPI003D95DAE9